MSRRCAQMSNEASSFCDDARIPAHAIVVSSWYKSSGVGQHAISPAVTLTVKICQLAPLDVFLC